MSKEYEFLKECGVFFVLTVKDNFPIGRPFGAVMELDNDLYIATSDTKAVYEQIINNPNMQIVAQKSGTRKWIRISGIAEECTNVETKQKMLDECPILLKHYASVDTPHYNVFKITVTDSQLN